MGNDYRKSESGKRRFRNPEVYKKTLEFQNEMAALRVAWHNHYADECTKDMVCCEGGNWEDLPEYDTVIPSFYESGKVLLVDIMVEVIDKKFLNKNQEKQLRDIFNAHLKDLLQS